MAWTETSASAWGNLTIKIGTPGANNAMSTSLSAIGTVKEDSFSVETEDGKKLQWFSTGHNLVDELQTQPTLILKMQVKNLNKSALTKFWDVEEDGTTGKLKVNAMMTTDKFSVSIQSEVVGSETLEIPYCSVSMKPVYSEDSGWEQEVQFTVLSPGSGQPLFQIGQVPAA